MSMDEGMVVDATEEVAADTEVEEVAVVAALEEEVAAE